MSHRYEIDAIDVQHAIAGEIGIGFFKRLSRGVKSAARSVAKVATPIAKVGRAVIHSPYVQAGLTGLAMVMPVTAPLAAGVIAADKLITQAEHAAKPIADAAKAMVRNTKALAKAGDPNAVRALKTLKLVYKRRKEVRAMSPAQRDAYNRQAAETERRKAALISAARKHEKAIRLRGHVITSSGRILKGTFTQES